MIRRLCALSLAFSLMACAAATPEATITQSCATYGRSLSTLAAARYQGRLSADQITAIDNLNTIVIPVCTAPTPPANGQAVLDGANQALEALIFTTGAK